MSHVVSFDCQGVSESEKKTWSSMSIDLDSFECIKKNGGDDMSFHTNVIDGAFH